MVQHAHIIEQPKWVEIIRIVQAVLSVILLGFSAYGVSYIAFNAYCLTLFTALWTILVLAYYIVSIRFAPQAYNWIAVLVLETLTTIFWLSSFATLAALYSSAVNAYHDYSYYYYYYRRSLEPRSTTDVSTYRNVLICAIVFSVITWLLFCATLAMLGLGIQKHRKAGGPMKADGTTTTTSHEMTSTAADVEKGQAAQPVAPVQPVHAAEPEMQRVEA
ncbi:Hypothetical protein R9X50_00350800 [Acrodontium crateriforme]|uniref:MARVEL domain-containing protein n=1 Tax=Acrodontium crateriforme TaxID=150365 RepID=A0AAQ3M3S5_9PEZI|nr:Hypothetical protein R9X50_00350800 [Acrodontium crateriforme]